jgi:CheY-like chemotaxis protein
MSEDAPNGRSVDLSGLKILVVDDEPETRRLIKWILVESHAEVVTASSAAEALPLMTTVAPDILISDIGMPVVDGYEFLKQIRSLDSARGGKVPAIALTAFASREDEAKSHAAGFSVHISKPIVPDDLTATVANLTGRIGRSRSAV